MNKNELKVGNVYLMKIKGILNEVYLNNITDTSYNFYVKDKNGYWYIYWVLKDNFDTYCKIIEYLHKRMHPPIVGDNDSIQNSVVICPNCDGEGTIPNDLSPTSKATCPKCWGSGVVPRKIRIL